jgi:hypothetical protein
MPAKPAGIDPTRRTPGQATVMERKAWSLLPEMKMFDATS